MALYSEAQMIALARQLLNDSTTLFWSDIELVEWVRQGTVDVSTKGRCVDTLIPFPLVVGNQSYTKPTGLLGIETILAPNGSALARLRARQFGHVNAGTDPLPSSFALFSNTILFFPVPQVAATLSILYWFSTDQVLLLKEGYQNLVLLYVLMKARLKEQRYAEAAQLQSMYLNELQFQRRDLQEYEPDTKETLRFADRVVRNG